ncbi:hypothetical protein IL306_008846, partial [Fusarium sp. DS 682]
LQKLAPRTPRDKNLTRPMTKMIEKFKDAGRDPNEMWCQDGKYNVTTSCGKLSNERSQRGSPRGSSRILSFKVGFHLRLRRDKTSQGRRSRKLTCLAHLSDPEFPPKAVPKTLNQGRASKTSAESSIRETLEPEDVVSVNTDDSDVELPLASTASTILNLEQNECFESHDIQCCAGIFPERPDWQVFERG